MDEIKNGKVYLRPEGTSIKVSLFAVLLPEILWLLSSVIRPIISLFDYLFGNLSGSAILLYSLLFFVIPAIGFIMLLCNIFRPRTTSKIVLMIMLFIYLVFRSLILIMAMQR